LALNFAVFLPAITKCFNKADIWLKLFKEKQEKWHFYMGQIKMNGRKTCLRNFYFENFFQDLPTVLGHGKEATQIFAIFY